MAIFKSKMAYTNRDCSQFFLLMAVDRPSINFVSCTMTSIECNNSEIILKIDFQIIMNNKIQTYKNLFFKNGFE